MKIAQLKHQGASKSSVTCNASSRIIKPSIKEKHNKTKAVCTVSVFTFTNKGTLSLGFLYNEMAKHISSTFCNS